MVIFSCQDTNIRTLESVESFLHGKLRPLMITFVREDFKKEASFLFRCMDLLRNYTITNFILFWAAFSYHALIAALFWKLVWHKLITIDFLRLTSRTHSEILWCGRKNKSVDTEGLSSGREGQVQELLRFEQLRYRPHHLPGMLTPLKLHFFSNRSHSWYFFSSVFFKSALCPSCTKFPHWKSNDNSLFGYSREYDVVVVAKKIRRWRRQHLSSTGHHSLGF